VIRIKSRKTEAIPQEAALFQLPVKIKH